MVSLCIYHERVPVWRTEGTYEVFTYVEIDMSRRRLSLECFEVILGNYVAFCIRIT